MKFQKGVSGNKAGRPAGCEGKVKKDIRSAFESIVEGNLSNIENWLSDVAADNPAKALEFVLRISEFVVPKMRSVEYRPVEPEKNYEVMAAIQRVNETYKGSPELSERIYRKQLEISESTQNDPQAHAISNPHYSLNPT